MSGYNYSDQGGCPGCNNRTLYKDLKQTTSYHCDGQCSCGNPDLRSTKDRMYYTHFVQDKPLNLQPLKHNGNWHRYS